jgi:hypothetical protein
MSLAPQRTRALDAPSSATVEQVLSQLGLAPRRVARALYVCCVALTALGVVGEWFSDADRWKYRLFQLNAEANVPTWFSAGQLLLAAVLAWTCGEFGAARGVPGRWSWRVVAGTLLFVSVDEVAQIHEQASFYVRRDLHLGGPGWWAWVIPYGAVGLALAATLLRWWRALPTATRRPLLVGGVVFVTGALGLELVEAAFTSLFDVDAIVRVLTVLEEAMEMIAGAFVVRVLLEHLCGVDRSTLSAARAADTA